MRMSKQDASRLAEAARIYGDEVRVRGIWLYAIQVGHSGPVKIGISSNPLQRLATLQRANPELLRPIACWLGIREDERLLHREFAHLRLQGEWFKSAPEVLALADQYGNEYDEWRS